MSGTDQNLLQSCRSDPCTFCESACSNSSTTLSSSKPVSDEPVKIHYTYNDIHQLFENSSSELKKCGYDYIVAIGGGGFIPARMCRTFLNVPIIAVTIKFYDEDDQISSEPDIIQWDSKTIDSLCGKKCLIVDEVYDTGSTMRYVVDRLHREGVKDLSVLILHQKIKDSNKENTSHILEKLQNFHPLVKVCDEWIVYPWETEDITEHNTLAQRDAVNQEN